MDAGLRVDRFFASGEEAPSSLRVLEACLLALTRTYTVYIYIYWELWFGFRVLCEYII